jgi:phosphoribosyl 1,2-cyclic phosphodiesterase
VRHFRAGTSLSFNHVIVETIPTPHDAADGVAFVVDDGIHRLGILTDLGHAFGRLAEVIQSLDAVLIESNYDPMMLAKGPYPESLKRRIRGPQGHLSNDESARLLFAAATSRMKWACLAHLSAENNKPELALRTHRSMLGMRVPLRLASRDAATDVMEI